MELKLKYTVGDIDKLTNELGEALQEAEDDYIRKKKAKREEVDDFKMMNAVNQRKEVKRLGKLLLAAHFNVGNILDEPAFNRASESLEREANSQMKP